jgi:hypothetical protein
MTITTEELILKRLDSVSSGVEDLKKESKTHGEALVRLEEAMKSKQVQCSLMHSAVDRRLDNLETFEEHAGADNAAALKSKADKAIDWNTWAVRLLLAIPVSVITTIIVIVIKGCA